MRINFKQITISLFGLLLASTAPAYAAINIFACEPEYAALAKEISGDMATIYSATTALQDPHFVQARPSLIAKMRRANLVICAGADLELGWLPMLQMKSNNRAVQSTDNGVFFAADYVDNLDIPIKVDRSMGDVHELGNPHVHLDPRRMAIVAKKLTAKIISLDPENGQSYQKNFDDFSARWQVASKRWQQQSQPLNGLKVVAYHSSFRYLFDFLGIEKVADLEPKPGLPPTSKHLLSVLDIVKQQKIKLVVYTGYQDKKAAMWLQDKTAITSLQLPYTVGGNEQATDLFTLMDSHLRLLLNAIATH